MKRSKVIEELVALFYSTDNLDIPNSSFINDEKLANEILTKLEELGMLPPFNKVGQVPFNTYDAILEAVSEDFSWEEE